MPFAGQRLAARTVALRRRPAHTRPRTPRLFPAPATGRQSITPASLFDPFDTVDGLNEALWQDLGAQAPTVGSGVLTVGDPSSGATTVRSRRPIDMTGGSVTIESQILRTDVYVAFTVATTRTGDGFLFRLAADHGTVTWTLEAGTTIGATISPFVAADWRWLRISSDPAATDEITVWHAPDVENWTSLGTVTVANPGRLAAVDVTVSGAA